MTYQSPASAVKSGRVNWKFTEVGLKAGQGDAANVIFVVIDAEEKQFLLRRNNFVY